MSEKNWNMDDTKKEYEEKQMTQEQLDGMKRKILQAKVENRRAFRVRTSGKVAAAAMAALLILPNISPQMAYAMSSIPVIGRLVEAVTIRDYKVNDERHTADIEVPELKADVTAAGVTEANAEIKQITDQIIAEFEANLKDREGFQDYVVKHETIATTEQYFTLKLICYQGAGSGSEWDYFYTIDRQTGQRVHLKDVFADGADYVAAVSENIKQQMRDQMKADSSKVYWVDDSEMPTANFENIDGDQNFYINADNQLVIAFNEGDVGPMSMGCVEFGIDNAAISTIRR